MKQQALFLSKINVKKLKVSSAAIFARLLRVNDTFSLSYTFKGSNSNLLCKKGLVL